MWLKAPESSKWALSDFKSCCVTQNLLLCVPELSHDILQQMGLIYEDCAIRLKLQNGYKKKHSNCLLFDQQ